MKVGMTKTNLVLSAIWIAVAILLVLTGIIAEKRWMIESGVSALLGYGLGYIVATEKPPCKHEYNPDNWEDPNCIHCGKEIR